MLTFTRAASPAVPAGLCLAWHRRRLTKAQEHSADQAYIAAAGLAGDGFLVLRPAQTVGGASAAWRIVACSDMAVAMLGLPRHGLAGKTLSEVLPAQSLPFWEKALEAGAHARQNIDDTPWVEDEIFSSDGAFIDSCKDSRGAAIPIQRRMAAHQGHVLVRLNTAQPRPQAAQGMLVQPGAHTDPITELPGRAWLTAHLPAMLRDPCRQVALLFIDLDGFRYVNDVLGHSAGDMLLRTAAMRLRSVLNEGDHVARLGGDEFAIVIAQPEGGDLRAEARQTARLVNEVLSFPLQLVPGKKSLTTSIGISLFPDDALEMESLLKHAEIAMYAVKGNGKAGYGWYTPALSEALEDRLSMEKDLSDALERDEFFLVFEPRMHVATGRISGMEALVRWQHPRKGLVSPQDFIPLAESNGMIVPLGEMVIDKAFRQVQAWRKTAVELVPVSINVSARQIQAGGLSRILDAALKTYGIPSGLIQVELTESSMIGNQDSAAEEFARLRALGIRLLLDDFGTGYSSLSQLQQLRMDVLKIDRSFLEKIGASRENEIFVRAIISMAHALEMSVIAEGVETRAQLQALSALGCDEIQGYLLSRPLSAKDALALLEGREVHPAA